MHVILQPTGESEANEHFIDTIVSPVDVSTVLSLVANSDVNKLKSRFGNRKAIPTWGVTPGKNRVNANKWDRIQPGDLALFAANKRFFASSFVVDKVHAPKLSQRLWRHSDAGETWEYVYFLDEVAAMNLSYAEFNELAGYNPNNIVRGFNVLDETKSSRISGALELSSRLYQPETSADEYLEAVSSQYQDLDDLNSPALVKRRKEQRFLRQELFGTKIVSTCCMCGREFSVDFLVASHIKKRSECSLKELKDFKHIVAPMCKYGCDALYEAGYIIVDDSGLVSQGRCDIKSSGVESATKSILKIKCLAWNPKTQGYFTWHRNRFNLKEMLQR
ncbi:MAG TPA: hypothetical protein VKT51_08855 [Candidatus Eremiobacteraceae bacterium]|nr:hypothetical protein [Candidatus Eremiobacteraceae bacterium]